MRELSREEFAKCRNITAEDLQEYLEQKKEIPFDRYFILRFPNTFFIFTYLETNEPEMSDSYNEMTWRNAERIFSHSWTVSDHSTIYRSQGNLQPVAIEVHEDMVKECKNGHEPIEVIVPSLIKPGVFIGFEEE